MIEIPEQLKKSDFRFCLVEKGGKRPFEQGWNNDKNYKYDDPKFLKLLEEGYNYGVVCGHRFGNLIVVDFDDPDVMSEILPKLPITLKVKTAGKGLIHVYYFSDVPNQIKIMDDRKKTLIDIQGTTRTGNGSQVVGPNSSLKSGKKYEIVDNSSISFISQDDLKNIFKDYILEEEIELLKKQSDEFSDENKPQDPHVLKIKSKIKLSQLLYKYGMNPNKVSPKGNIQCPLHASVNGKCLSIDDDKGVFFCFHCLWKGDIFTLRMMRETIDFKEAVSRFSQELGIHPPKLKVDHTKSRGDKEEISNEIMNNVQNFFEQKPFFYDKAKIYWGWNPQKFKYEITDEVNLINDIEEYLFMNGQIHTSALKDKYISAMQAVGRKQQPIQPPLSWIQFKDQIVDISKGTTFPATSEYFHTNPIPHKLGETEETPIMDEILKQWVGPDYVLKLQQIIAYCLLRDYSIHAIFALIGTGRNGKGLYHRLIQKFVGYDNVCSSDIDSLITNRFEAMNLYKKLVCFMGETNMRASKETDKLKKISGHDLITFEKKNKDPINDFNYAKIIIASNGLPYFNDNSAGLAARFHIINFPNQFSEGQDVLGKIPEKEYENLGKKCLRILNELLAVGQFDKTGTIEERKKKLDLASNPLPRFMEEWCDTGNEEIYYMKPNDLFAAYVKYVKIHQGVIPNKRQFYEALGREGYESELVRRGADNQVGRFLLGIMLKKEWFEYLKAGGKQQKIEEMK